MSNAIEHFSRYCVENTTLQVMADTQRNLAPLIHEEQSVIRHYARLGTWPHKRVNMFVLDDLKPLVAQIKKVTTRCPVVAEDIDLRPMINVYDASDLTECTVFVNRRVLKQEGAWRDRLSLRALLAHEHGHPLAENETVHAARKLSVEIAADSRIAKAAVGQILHLLADRLCLHAPQEVFANEIVIRSGFADALFHLDMGIVEKATLGMSKREAMVLGLERQVMAGELRADQLAAFLLIGDVQANLGFALETASFLRAGHRHQAEALEQALLTGVWAHLDPATMRLYEKFRDHYLRLTVNLAPAEMKAWACDAMGFLADALREKHLQVRFELDLQVGTRSRRECPQHPRSQPAAVRDGSLEHDGGLP